LLDGPRRFNEILQMGRSDSLRSRTLSRALKQLVGDGFVRRSILAIQPFAVEYSLTSLGEKLRKFLEAYRELDELVVQRGDVPCDWSYFSLQHLGLQSSGSNGAPSP